MPNSKHKSNTNDLALDVFNNLSSWEHLQALVDEGETEGVCLECNFLSSPKLNRDMKFKLARALSGFSNTAGGVVLWGVTTTQHSHTNLSVISLLTPVNNCASFEEQVRSAIPTLTSPNVLKFETKLIKKYNDDTQGIIAAYIPLTTGSPLMSNIDNVFYFRRLDEFVSAPYDLIKRLFSASDVPDVPDASDAPDAPDVYPVFSQDFIELEADGSWSLRILVDNRSTVFASNVRVSVTIENPSSCLMISASNFQDTVSIKTGKKVYEVDLERGIYKGMPVVTGILKVKMKRKSTDLDISIKAYANRMRSRLVKYRLTLTKSEPIVKVISDDYLY
jgi:hypothetical protein